MNAGQYILDRRDARAIPHLEQYAPVWIIDEVLTPEEEAVQFNVAFQHHLYGWVNRRYRFDAFNGVLYQKGQTLISLEEALEIQETEPYIVTAVADVPNSYGG